MNELIESLLYLIDVKKEYDIEREKCQYDWDYFGHYEIERLKNASHSFEEELNKLIDSRVDCGKKP